MDITKPLSQLKLEGVIGEWTLSGNSLDGLTLVTDPKPSLTQADIDAAYLRYQKKQKKHELAGVRDQHIYKNVTDANSNEFPVDKEDWQNFEEADKGLSRGWLTEPITWTRADESTIDLNHSAIIAILEKLSVRKLACYNHEKTLKSQIDSATTLEELNAIDLESGWPS